MCADGPPPATQTDEGEEMEKDPQAGGEGPSRAEITVSDSVLSPILCSYARPWTAELPGASLRPGDRLETTAGGRLGIRSRHPFGRAISISQNLRLEAGLYLRHQRPFVVP